ncbi:Ankyrin [Carabus blaptoides fortunei]
MANFCCSAVTQAIVDDNVEELMKLIRKRKRIDVQDNLGWSPLHVAVKKNSDVMVRILLDQPNILVNCRNVEGATSLFIAAESTSTKFTIIEELLKHGADPNIVNNEDISPLHLACSGVNINVVKLLLAHGANINWQDFNGYTPLHYAIERNLRTVITFLLENNADPSITESNQLNALMLALQQTECSADLILPHTNDLNAAAIDGWTALMFAVNKHSLTLVQDMVDRGADINARAGKLSPLNLAIMFGDYEMFELVWRHIHYPTVLNDPDFIASICKYWNLPHDYEQFRLVFNTPAFDIKLKGKPRIFSKLFKDVEHLEFETGKQKYFDVIGWFLKKGVRLVTKDLENTIKYFRTCPYQIEVWELIFRLGMPDVTEHIIAVPLCNNNINLASFFMSFCVHLQPENLYEYVLHEYNLNDNVLKFITAFFTPSSTVKKKFIHTARCEDQSERYFHILNSTNGVRSLLEQSRDRVRGIIQEKCETSREYMNVLDQLILPLHIKNIIRCTVPVNKYPL